MNIKPKYYDGIKLKKGKYDIKVSHKGYQTIRHWIKVEKNEYFTVTLPKKTPKKTSYSQTGHSKPSLSHLSSEEKISIEVACSSASYSGPAKYNKCLQRQLSKLGE